MDKETNQRPPLGTLTFKVSVDGTEITDFLFYRIQITKALGKINEARIIIQDGESGSDRFKATDAEIFTLGKAVDIEAGYEGRNHILFKGLIIKQALKGERGGAWLIVTAKGKAYRLATVRRSRIFKDCTDSDVMHDICKGYSLPLDADSTKTTHETLIQYDTSDWDFLNLRADANALLVAETNEGIRIRRPDFTTDPVLDLDNCTGIYDFEAELDGSKSFANYTAAAWNYSGQEVAEISASCSEMDVPIGNEDTGQIASDLQQEDFHLNLHTSVNGDGIPAELLEACIMRNNMTRICGKITMTGSTDANPGDIISLGCMGKRFKGNTVLSSVSHLFENNSWTTELQFGADNGMYCRRYEDIAPVPAMGLLSPVSGLQTAKVVQLTGDPQKEARILVNLPHISEGESNFWARVATLDAGKGRGTFFLPEVGDEVVIGFIDNAPHDAVILGMLHSSNLPSPQEYKDENDIRGIYSREKVKLEFNEKDRSFQLRTPDGNTLTANDKDGKTLLEDSNGNTIVLDADGIILKSAKDLKLEAAGNISVQGDNITQKASLAMSVSGDLSAEVKSSGNTVVKGNMVQIN